MRILVSSGRTVTPSFFRSPAHPAGECYFLS
jgi:hypothetical protein